MTMSPRQHDEHLEIEHLREELHELQRRVDALERGTSSRPQPVPILAAAAPIAEVELPVASAPNAVPILGRAILGLAGAYLLRALAESSALPRLPVIGAAILYAFGWLVFSIWDMRRSTLAGTTYAVTASLILMPLLWEATVRFGALPAAAAASILLVFLVLSLLLPFVGSVESQAAAQSGSVAAVSAWATLLTAIVLMIQTGDLLPFELAVLAIVGVIEVGACVGHARNLRVPAAIAADFAIWVMLFVTTRPGGIPEHYKSISTGACVAFCGILFVIYSASIAWQTVTKRRSIMIAEIVQTATVFLLAAGGTLYLTQFKAAPAVGGLSALACAACYFAAFTRFGEAPRRNHHVFAAWGVILGICACILILPPLELIVIWSAAAVLALLAGSRTHQPTLILHGNLYLVAAALASGLAARLLNAFTGTSLLPAEPALWIIVLSAACCYTACLFATAEISARASIFSALILAVSVASLLVLLLVPMVGGRNSPSFVATFRTLVTCGLALGLAFAGSRGKRRELIWISYAAIALGTIKLITEDFRTSHPAGLAVSLVFYGGLLILVPKLSSKSATN